MMKKPEDGERLVVLVYLAAIAIVMDWVNSLSL